jgi:hypothetical protein
MADFEHARAMLRMAHKDFSALTGLIKNAETSASPYPISWATTLMGNRDHSDGCALNPENQCVGETLEIQTNRSM